MHLWQTNPFQTISLTHGEGCYVRDATGKTYLDMLAGTWCNVLGYGHPGWISAVQEQVSKLTHTGWPFITNEINDALAKLAEILSPQFKYSIFLNTGSEAVELSLKIARATTGADGIVVISGSYYGATTYTLSLSEAGRTANYLPSFDNIERLPVPNCQHCPMGYSRYCDGKFSCLDPLALLAEKNERKIAAVLYEPVLGGGIITPPLGYGARLHELTSRCNALLIAEEVTTGMGRTGRWFGFEHENIVPDILVIGKAIGAGLPISVVVTTDKVENLCQGKLGRHVQSHQNDPFSGRIAAAVISILQNEHLVEDAAERGNYLMTGLKKLQATTPWIRDVRGRGAMIGVELHQNLSNKGVEITERMLNLGFILDFHVPTSTFRLFPPFIISNHQLDSFLQAFDQVLTEKENNGK
jgi:4-aminobutyrate aminotransferase-like enzyme